jgi:hypothetical protein
MRRMLVIIAFAFALSVGLGIWYVLHPPVDLWIVPGATQVEVRNIGLGEQTITYHSAERSYAWRLAVERNLLAHGWMVPAWYRPDMPGHGYLRKSDFWFGTIWDQADLWGELGVSRITTRRWFQFPGWVYRSKLLE